MKKWFIGLLIGAVLLISSVYLFIPNVISIKSEMIINTSRSGLFRILMDNEKWAKWWPSKEILPSTDYNQQNLLYNGISYKVNSKNISQLKIDITDKAIYLSSVLYLISSKSDSVKLVWESQLPTSYNLIKRFFAYQKAQKIKRDFDSILKKMGTYFSKTENIYTAPIEQVLVSDTSLIATFGNSKNYPSTAFIYSLIDKLKIYALSNGAQETGFPMLNINTTDSVNFTVKVALPVNKRLPNTETIFYKWMMYGGKILVMEVKGGNGTTNKALLHMSDYISDFQRMAPAIPFFSLVTDRRNEPDSSKWTTKIYYPVM